MRSSAISKWLHVPWTTEAELKQEHETWAAAYETTVRDRALPETGGQENLPHDGGSDAEYEQVEPNDVQAEWMHIAQQQPNQPVTSVEVGNRECDE